MARALWNGIVVAESDETVVVEGNHYFPRDSVREDVLRPSDHRTVCPWKGVASYWSLEHDGVVSRDAAWTYRTPLPTARRVKERVAFAADVRTEE